MPPSGSRASLHSSTADPPPGWPGCSSGPSWPVGGGLSQVGCRRAAGLSTQFRPCYTTVAAAGKKAEDIAARLVCEVVKPLVADLPKLTLALDDTPTQRYGPFVQGAGIHHNPTPGPAGSPHVYGHVWVVLGTLGRPIPCGGRSRCRFRRGCTCEQKDLPAIYPQASACVPNQAGDDC